MNRHIRKIEEKNEHNPITVAKACNENSQQKVRSRYESKGREKK